MSVTGKLMPLTMGGLMGLMMMWMLHGALTGDSAMGAGALIAFVAVHVVLVAVVFGAALFAARLSPRAQGWISRLHRPSLRHVAVMLASAILVSGAVHLSVHGLGGV